MKKITAGLVSAALFVCGVLAADGKINRKHHSMTGKDKAKIDCVYCHVTAKIPKKKGQNKAALYKSPSCAGAKCHR